MAPVGADSAPNGDTSDRSGRDLARRFTGALVNPAGKVLVRRSRRRTADSGGDHGGAEE